jgi:hypothetical protein
MSANEKIAKLIRAVGKGESQLTGSYTATKTDEATKVAEIEPSKKTQGAKPMENFSADKVISAVNSASSLDEALKAYTSSSNYNTLDQDPTSSAKKS